MQKPSSKPSAPLAAPAATACMPTAAPTAATGTLAIEDLSGHLVALEGAIQQKRWAERRSDELGYFWVVHQPLLLVGLRVAAIISLGELHGWSKAEATEFLDKWLASSKSEVSVYLSCLSRRAMEELIVRIENAE